MLFGGSGRLGKEIVAQRGDIHAPTHKEVDITKKSNIRKAVLKTKPECIIHTVALTSVTECEENHKKAWDLNIGGTKNIVRTIQKYTPNTTLIYISTPSVFACTHGDYSEEDIPNPTNYYGITKLIAEQIVLTLESSCVIRTNFITREKWKYQGAYTDRFGTYLYADQVAGKILFQRIPHTVYHLTGDRKLSMYEVAKQTTPSVKKIRLPPGSYLNRDMSLVSLYNTGFVME